MVKVKELWDKGKEIKAEADAGQKQEKIRKQVEKKKEQLEKQKTEEVEKLKAAQYAQQQTKKEYRAYVVINLTNGVNIEQIAVLGAEIDLRNDRPVLRVRDKDENIIFEEPKPDAGSEFHFFDKTTIDKKIAECEKALRKIQSGEKKSVDGLYEVDWLEKYKKYEAKRTHLLLGEQGTYSYNVNGVPHYTFDVVGYFKIPKFHYTNKSVLSIPPIGKLITAQILTQRLKDELNFDKDNAQKLMNTIYGILIAVALIGSIFLMYKSGQVDAEMALNFKEATNSLTSLINNSNQLDAIQTGVNEISTKLAENVTDTGPTKDLGKTLN